MSSSRPARLQDTVWIRAAFCNGECPLFYDGRTSSNGVWVGLGVSQNKLAHVLPHALGYDGGPRIRWVLEV